MRFHLPLLGSRPRINSLDLYLFSWTWNSSSWTWASLTLTSLSLLVLRLWFHSFRCICILNGNLFVFFSQFMSKLRILFCYIRYSRSGRSQRIPWTSFLAYISSCGAAIGSFALHGLWQIRYWFWLCNFLKIWMKLGHFLTSIRILRQSDIVNVLHNISVHVITSQLGSTNSLIYLSLVHWSLPISRSLIALFCRSISANRRIKSLLRLCHLINLSVK